MKNPKVVLLIFVSGKVVVTGAKVNVDDYSNVQSEDQIKEAFEKISHVLYRCRKEQFCSLFKQTFHKSVLMRIRPNVPFLC